MSNHRRTAFAAGLLLAIPHLGVAIAHAQWHESDVDSFYSISAEDSGDQFGSAAANLGDIDGDGVDDFVISAPGSEEGIQDGGKVYVYSGATGSLLFDIVGQRVSGRFGVDVAGIGDVNGDGIRDLLAGSIQPPALVHVISGAVSDQGAILHTFHGGNDIDFFGGYLAGGGDFDGDGLEDFVIGAPGFNNGRGRVYVHTNLDTAPLCEIDGEQFGDNFGTAVAMIGDVTGDGRDDIAIGAWNAGGGGKGYVYAWNGKSCDLIYTVDPNGAAFGLDAIDGGRDLNNDGVPDFVIGDRLDNRTYVFSGADGSTLHTLTGENEGGSFGGDAAFIDDSNGDGVSDVIVSAPSNDFGDTNAGKVFLYSGLDGSLIRTITRTLANATFGSALVNMGDLNGDFAPDFLIGGNGDGPPSFYGRTWVIEGHASGDVIPIGLTGCALTFGSTDNDSCNVANLQNDDDVDQILRSQFGFSAFERNLVEIVMNGNNPGVDTMVSINTRDGSDTTNVIAKVKARNYVTNSIDDIAQYSVSFPSDDTAHTTPVDDADYVDGNGDIEVRLRYVAPATFTPLGFTVGLDQVQVMVN